MPFLLKLLPLFKSWFAPVFAWWGKLNINDKITIIIIVIVGGIIGVQYISIRQHNKEIMALKAQVAELATKAELARIDGRIESAQASITTTNANIGKLETDLGIIRSGVKAPTITGMSESAIVDAFKKLGEP
jgi:hypothetical protein